MADRDWRDAHAAHAAARCRIAQYDPRHVCEGPLEHAHVSGRKYDKPREGTKTRWVHPDDVVKLCQAVHRRYDAHDFDLLPYLTPEEQARAVLHRGSIIAAARHLGGRDFYMVPE